MQNKKYEVNPKHDVSTAKNKKIEFGEDIFE